MHMAELEKKVEKKLNKDEIVEYARKHQGMRTLKDSSSLR